ncbi:MAG: hypothetical protein OXC60_01455 [Litoreibacter sp.]|nr:hypothetical protein [Litoreibacter sp.]
MRKTLTGAALIATIGLLSACDNDFERGAVGAGAGVVVSKAVGGDATTGALLGTLAGVFCDDAGVCD